MASFAFKATKWTLDIATKLIKADVRLHNAEYIEDDMAIIFVVNHFTRIETLLLPYEIYKHTGLEVWSLAAAELFVGRIGSYLRSAGNISTKDPDRDKIIIRTLLSGEHPWIIFPEGQMIKDKKVVGPEGNFRVFNNGRRRPPHRGAAALALRAEFYRHKLACLKDRPDSSALEQVLKRFELDSVDRVLSKRTVIIPVNITYFPLRARENFLVRAAREMFGGLDPRAVEELSVEGTILSEDTDIDITLGEPILAKEYLDHPKYAAVMACGDDDMAALERNPRSLFNDAALKLMVRYMEDIYRLTTVNYDHIFATIIRHQRARRFTERSYRNRIFLCAHEIIRNGKYRIHGLLKKTYRSIIYEDPSTKFNDFMDLCLSEGWIVKEGDTYRKVFGLKRGNVDFHSVRKEQPTYVIANEIEPLADLTRSIKRIARLPRKELSSRIREIFLKEDHRIFDEDYRDHADRKSLPRKVGRPFLLVPDRCQGGVVLVHGYLAAPMEIRPLAEFLCRKGYAVYGVRLKGHGTSPEDLAQTTWEEWYESLNRGYTIIKTLTNRIILGGFSTGGGLALLAAGRKGNKIDSVFAVNTPLQLRRLAARLAPSLVTMNNLIRKVKGEGWMEFVENESENPKVNYDRNPVSGVWELDRAMDAMEEELENICVPTLILQGAKDPIVHPDSASLIFEKVGTPHKEMTLLERHRHGIIYGPGCEDIFERIHRFLRWARKQNRAESSDD